jgi:[acyl-carrier-protein] S-malonyltransferase
MAEALAAVVIARPLCPVVVNVRAEAVEEPDRFRDLLIAQVTGSVRWRESVEWMDRAGVNDYWEVGAGKALSGMIKRIAAGASTRAIGTPEDVAAAKG